MHLRRKEKYYSDFRRHGSFFVKHLIKIIIIKIIKSYCFNEALEARCPRRHGVGDVTESTVYLCAAIVSLKDDGHRLLFSVPLYVYKKKTDTSFIQQPAFLATPLSLLILKKKKIIS